MHILKKFPTKSGELYYGQIPSIQTLEELKKRDVYAIWNLAEELSMIIPFEQDYVHEVIRGSVEDFQTPANSGRFISQLKHIVSLLRSGKRVFVHCFGGSGRTGMALASIKVMLDGATSEQALRLAKIYANGPETQAQRRFVKFLEKYFART